MPPIFRQEDFEFAEDVDVPEHIERVPLGRSRDIAKYALLIESVGASFYLAAMNIDDRETTELLSEAFLARMATRKKELEESARFPEVKYALNSQYVMHILAPEDEA